VALEVELGGIDQAAADDLVEAAHQVCPYWNATRDDVPVALTATVA
jgi:organic hydroperoxide reductase OsmC/OhrA